MLVLEDIAPEVFDHPAYLVCFEAVFRGIYGVAKTEGELTFTVDQAGRRVRGEFRW